MSSPAFCCLELVNDTTRPANELRLCFALRHGGLELVRAASDGKVRQVAATARSLRVRWPHPVEPGQRVKLTLRAPGSPLRLVGSAWSEPKAEAAGVPAPVAEDDPLSTDYSVIDCWRAERAQVDPVTRAAKLFFNFLDRETLQEPSQWTFPGVDAADRMEALGQELRAHLLAGLRHRRKSPPLDCYYALPCPPAERARLDRQLGTIHALFEGAFLHAFELPAPPGAPLVDRLDLEGIKDAFTWFAAGGLRMVGSSAPPSQCPGIDPQTRPHQFEEFMVLACQPDSGMFLLFAELAQACSMRGIGEDLWRALLPAQVHAIWTFLGRYAPGSGALLSDFGPKLVPDQDAPDLAALRAERQLFEGIVAAAPEQELYTLWKKYLVNVLSPNA